MRGALRVRSNAGGHVVGRRTKSISLIGEQVGGEHGIKNGFVFNEKLYNHGKHVGRDQIKITSAGKQGYKVSALFRFHQGKIKVAGLASRGSQQNLPVVGGSGKYQGVSGTLHVQNKANHKTREIFHLSR